MRTFYLANADVKQTLTMIRTLVKTRDIFVDEKLSMLTMRDTPEAVRIAEKLIASQDLPEPEVVLEVEVLEIQRSRLLDLGVVWPNQFTVLNIVPNPRPRPRRRAAWSSQTTDQTTTTTQLTVATLRNLTSASIGVSPNPQLNLRSDAANGNLLANPRIRVRNKEKARIHIGDKVPVITTTSTANVGVSESVSYLDIGLEARRRAHHLARPGSGDQGGPRGEQHRARGDEPPGHPRPTRSGTRTATTVLRVKDGETQVLAGLISDQDRTQREPRPGPGPAAAHRAAVLEPSRRAPEDRDRAPHHAAHRARAAAARGAHARVSLGHRGGRRAPRRSNCSRAAARGAAGEGGAPVPPRSSPSPTPKVSPASARRLAAVASQRYAASGLRE